MSDSLINRKPAYPSFSISKSISSLQNDYQSKEMKDAFTVLEQKYYSFRNVRGDGNCFIRAAAFSYITTKKLKFMKEVFKNIQNIDIVSMYKESIPRAFHEIYNKKSMIQILLKLWDDKMKASENTLQSISNKLGAMLSDHVVLDFIVIAYFRSICLDQYKRNKTQYEPYGIGNQMQIINTYGMQSQGLIIRILSDALKTNITINQIDRIHGFTEIKYDYQNTQDNIHLLFKPGHYDVLQNPKKINTQDFGYKPGKYDRNMRSTVINIKINKREEKVLEKASEKPQSSDQPKTGHPIVWINNGPRGGKIKNVQPIQSNLNQIVIEEEKIISKKQIQSFNYQQTKLNCIDCIQLRRVQNFKEDLCFQCHINLILSENGKNKQNKLKNQKQHRQIKRSRTINIISAQIQEYNQTLNQNALNLNSNMKQNNININMTKQKTKQRKQLTIPMFDQQQSTTNKPEPIQFKCSQCNKYLQQKNMINLCNDCLILQSSLGNKIKKKLSILL